VCGASCLSDNLLESHFNNRLVTKRDSTHSIKQYDSSTGSVICVCGFETNEREFSAHLRASGKKPKYGLYY
jgi:hypothetical protein